jgi:Uma2 family endonuclease
MPDGGQSYEVFGGQLIVNRAPTLIHQRVVGAIYRLLYEHARDHETGEVLLAPLDVLLSHFDAIQPDIVFVASERPRIAGERNFLEGAPDLVVEVISPTSRTNDRVRKMALYARSGVSEYWIADPERRSLEIHLLETHAYRSIEPDSDGLLASRVLPGLRVDSRAVFIDVIET